MDWSFRKQPVPKKHREILAGVPDMVIAVCVCKDCGEPLVRADTGWVCADNTMHSGLIYDDALVEMFAPHLPPDKTKPSDVATGREIQVAKVLNQLKYAGRRGLIPKIDMRVAQQQATR